MRHPLAARAGAVTALALTFGCMAQPKAPPKPDENGIRAALNAQLANYAAAAFKARDPAAFARLFADDAVWILPDASAFRGSTDIEAGAKSLLASFPSVTMGNTTIDKLIVVSDSEAVTFSHGDYTTTAKGKPPEARVNPFADYWKKGSDGTWRIAYEVNADGPAPKPAAK